MCACRVIVGGAAVAMFGGVHVPAAAQFLESGIKVHLNIAGAVAGDQFGWVARPVGDLDGDGHDDFAVGAPTNDEGGVNAGKMYVYSGATGAILFSAIGSPGGWFGFKVGALGDLTGDGVQEVFSSGAAAAGGVGAVRIYSGATGALMFQVVGENFNDLFGYTVTVTSDVNGDGVADFAVGAPQHDSAGVDSGRVYLISGADGETICTIDGDGPGDQMGAAVDDAPDLDGDGRTELVISAQFAGPTNTGLVFVYNIGQSCERRLTVAATAPVFSLGQLFVESVGDIDGDGVGDVFAGDFDASRAFAWSGATGDPIWSLFGGVGEGYGIGKSIGDLDGDGSVDFVIGAYTSSVGGAQAGRAYVVSGAGPSTLRTFTYKITGANFGFDCAAVGDVNGDDVTDYLITAALEDSARGRVYVILGQIPPGPADLNHDFVVSGGDLALLLAMWGNPGSADLNGDGATNGADLAILLAAWS